MISTTEATKDLTSAIKGFKLSSEEAMSVVDKLTKIDQVAAISAGNLAEGLARVATTAQQAGLSLDETAAMVTTITEVTQRDASTAGEALRTLISRYSNVKAGVFTDMSEGAEETSGNINDIEKVLSKLGIRIRTSGTEMRSIEDVLDDLAEKWDTLDDVSRNAVASAFAGVRQRESFNILLSNWSRVKELTEESANAAGTADEKYTAYMDSMEAATKRLQNAWEGFTQSLESSAIMKGLTNAVAFLVENADALKHLITGIAVVSSAKIFDFFTSKGETGGLKGLIASLPFVGRGAKTNNILESIDRKVGNIEKGVGANSLTNQTKNGGFFKRLWSFVKAGFGFGDIYDPETEKSISYGKYQTLRHKKGRKPVSQKQMKKYGELLKQRRIQNITMGAISAVATNLLTTKQVGASGLGKWVNKTDQTAEETIGDKVLRTALSGGLAAAGGFLGPFGAMLGQLLGENFAGMFSTWFHRDELEMKQRVADARENLTALSEVQSSISENSDVMKKAVLEGDEGKQLGEYVDKIRNFFIDNTDFAAPFLEKFKSEYGNEYGSVSAILKNINAEDNAKDVEFRRKVETYFEETIAELKTRNTLASQEKERSKIVELYGLDIKGITLEDKLENAKQTLRELKSAGDDKKSIKSLESTIQELETAILQEGKLNKEWLESAAQEGYLKTDIKNRSKTKLTQLGLEGAIGLIADQMKAQGIEVRTDGKIHQDVYDIIKAAIKTDPEISSALERGSLTIGEYLQNPTVYEDRIKQFALAFNLTKEEAEDLGGTFKDLTIELGNMTPSDVLEYYQKFSDVLSEVTSSGGLTAKTLNTIIKEMPRLAPFIFQGADELESEVYKAILGGEMDLVYKNALNNQIFSNEGVYEYFKTKYSNLSDAAKEQTSLLGLKELIGSDKESEDAKAYYDFINNKELEYRKDLTVQNQLREYQISLMNDEVNNLEEQKSALSNINEQRKKELDYIKAKNALEDARKEKKRVFRSGVGWTYEVDEAAISEAKEKVDSLQVERDQEAIQYQIDAINAQKAFLEALPDQAQNERLKTLMDEFTKGDDSMLERVKKLSEAYADATVKMGLTDPSADDSKGNNTSEEKTIPSSTIKAQVSGLGGALWEQQSGQGKKIRKIHSALKGMGYTDRGFLNFDLFNLTYDGKTYSAGSYNHGVTDNSLIEELNKSYGEGTPIKGEVIYYNDPTGKATGLYTYNNKNDWRKVVLLDDLSADDALKKYTSNASGTTSFSGGQTLINELGTEAVITPGGTLTALPSKTGIVPADITRNVWALGEIAPTLVARLSSLTQKTQAGNAGNTTYEEGQYIDNLTMNVYPAKGDDFNKILEQARAQVRLTRRNN